MGERRSKEGRNRTRLSEEYQPGCPIGGGDRARWLWGEIALGSGASVGGGEVRRAARRGEEEAVVGEKAAGREREREMGLG